MLMNVPYTTTGSMDWKLRYIFFVMFSATGAKEAGIIVSGTSFMRVSRKSLKQQHHLRDNICTG
jgi:hypothetical protein